MPPSLASLLCRSLLAAPPTCSTKPLLLALLSPAPKVVCARGRPGASDDFRWVVRGAGKYGLSLAADEVRPDSGRCAAKTDPRVSVWGGVPGDAGWLSPRMRLSPRLNLHSADCALTGDAGADAACPITCEPGAQDFL